MGLNIDRCITQILKTLIDALSDFLRSREAFALLMIPQGLSILPHLKKTSLIAGIQQFQLEETSFQKLLQMCKECGIMGYKTNHSLRATATTRLYESGIDEQLVMERTGHRSIEGARSYKRTTNKQAEADSDILSKRQCREVAISELTRKKDNACSLPESTVTSNTIPFAKVHGKVWCILFQFMH